MRPHDLTTAGGRIRKARLDRRLTLRELAERTGVSPNYLSAVERNDKKQASASLMRKIADATGVTSEWLQDGASAVTEDMPYEKGKNTMKQFDAIYPVCPLSIASGKPMKCLRENCAGWAPCDKYGNAFFDGCFLKSIASDLANLTTIFDSAQCVTGKTPCL